MKLGTWQKETLNPLPTQAPGHNPLRDLKGSAKNYSGKYKASLKTLEEAGLIEPSPGPRGDMAWIVTEAGLKAVGVEA